MNGKVKRIALSFSPFPFHDCLETYFQSYTTMEPYLIKLKRISNIEVQCDHTYLNQFFCDIYFNPKAIDNQCLTFGYDVTKLQFGTMSYSIRG